MQFIRKSVLKHVDTYKQTSTTTGLVGENSRFRVKVFFYQDAFPVEGRLLDERFQIGFGHDFGGVALKKVRVVRAQEIAKPVLIKTLKN